MSTTNPPKHEIRAEPPYELCVGHVRGNRLGCVCLRDRSSLVPLTEELPPELAHQLAAAPDMLSRLKETSYLLHKVGQHCTDEDTRDDLYAMAADIDRHIHRIIGEQQEPSR